MKEKADKQKPGPKVTGRKLYRRYITEEEKQAFEKLLSELRKC